MRDLTSDAVAEAVIATMRDTKDSRLAEILESLVRHLHSFIRDVELTRRRSQPGSGLPDTHRADVHTDAPGIHPAVRRVGHHHAGRRPG